MSNGAWWPADDWRVLEEWTGKLAIVGEVVSLQTDHGVMARNQHESNDGRAAMPDEDAPIPGSVFNPRQVRTLKIVVIVLGVLLVLGFALLIAGLYHEATKLGGETRRGAADRTGQAATVRGDVRLDVPAGARIDRIAVDGGRVVLHIRAPDGEQVVIVDTAQGNTVMRLRLEPR